MLNFLFFHTYSIRRYTSQIDNNRIYYFSYRKELKTATANTWLYLPSGKRDCSLKARNQP